MATRDDRGDGAAAGARGPTGERRGAVVRAFGAIVVGAALGLPLATYALRDLGGAVRAIVFVAGVVLGGFVGGYLAGSTAPTRSTPASQPLGRRHARDHT